MSVDKRKGAESELQPKPKSKPKPSPKQSESTVVVNIQGEIVGFCNEAHDYLEVIGKLYEALDHFCDFPNTGPDEVDQIEIGVARDLLGLITEQSKKLNDKAAASSKELEEMSKAIESGSWAARCTGF
jgi:hypothetical protein